jgi:prepilin-type N-terminal cleavage/methylation domain-containing protein
VPWWRDQRGFTLGELLIAFAVLAIVLAGILVVHDGALRAYVAGSNRTEVQQSARVALERVAREIRNACMPAGGQIVTAAAVDSLTFTAIDPPPPAAGGVCTAVTYTNTVIANTLTRNGQVVAAGVPIVTFTYRDTTGNVLAAPVANPANVRRVDVTIETQSQDPLVAGRHGPGDVRSHFLASARIRNANP